MHSSDPVEDVQGLQRIAYGFMGSKGLFVALNLNLFGLVADAPKGLNELAEQTEVSPNLLRIVLTACVSVGLLIKDGDAYGNSPAAQRYLVPESSSYFGDYYRFQIDRQVYPGLVTLDGALRGKAVRGLYAGGFDNPERAADFFRGQHSGSLGPAFVLAREVDLQGRRSLLDVGGGSGAFSIMLCQRFPQLSATILDFPGVGPISEGFVADAGLADRIQFSEGDALTTDWPGEQDVVLMSYLLSAVHEREHGRLWRKAWSCLDLGGLLLVHDFVVNDEGTGPVEAALWGLAMMIGNTGATNLSPTRLVEQAKQAGFQTPEVRPLIEGITSLLTCSKAS